VISFQLLEVIMIVVQELVKAYAKGSKRAVDSLSLRIPNGKIYGFLGPNGAGKTTTIKMVTGILGSDSGSVEIDGISMAKEPIRAKTRFGYVSDNPETFSRLKASEYLNFLGDVYGVPTELRVERVNRYSSLFKIRDVLDAKVSSFSHGMKQKLGLVGSLIHDPDNWILDEPMVGLDPEAAFDLKTLMRERADSGKCVFFSTHIMEVAEKICDEICILRSGALVYEGTIAGLRARRGSEESLEELFLELAREEGKNE
jgi:ABC-2 type transport system ATP-binding protein